MGQVPLVNAHPHRSGNVALAHNGQLANDIELRNELNHLGVKVAGETDSEVAAHHLALALQQYPDPLAALRATTAKFEGTFAIVALVAGPKPYLLAVRQDNPLVLGWGPKGALYAASDVMAMPDGVRLPISVMVSMPCYQLQAAALPMDEGAYAKQLDSGSVG